jgi:uncharacterized protein
MVLKPDIIVRNVKLGRRCADGPRWYIGNDPIATAFYNSLTTVFPPGERFFISSVNLFRKNTPPQLANEIRSFVQQEALHTREHIAFNLAIESAGYDATAMEGRTVKTLQTFENRSPLRRLGLTISLEHFTALFANALLAQPHHLADTTQEVRNLWRWHALEEIEHKAVAFDTFLWATQDWSPIRRWTFRSLVMLEATWFFVTTTALNIRDFLAQDAITGSAAFKQAINYLFGDGGIMRAIGRGWFSWFRPGFHPWQEDNRALIAQVGREFAAT